MKRVKVNKAELLETVKKNREDHHAEYKVAFQEYIEAGKVAIEQLLDDFKKDPNTPLCIDIMAPASHIEEYDDAILILEASCEEEIELDRQEVNQLILNKWHWVGDLDHTRTIYANYLKIKK